MMDKILRFKSLPGLIILLIYFMQQRTVKTLLGCREFNVCLSKNGKSVLLAFEGLQYTFYSTRGYGVRNSFSRLQSHVASWRKHGHRLVRIALRLPSFGMISSTTDTVYLMCRVTRLRVSSMLEEEEDYHICYNNA